MKDKKPIGVNVLDIKFYKYDEDGNDILNVCFIFLSYFLIVVVSWRLQLEAWSLKLLAFF